MLWVLRVIVPDSPGALGRTAAAIGAAEGDILRVEVLQRHRGRAVDDFVVSLPDGASPDALLHALAAVPDTAVEALSPSPHSADHLAELELLSALSASPTRAVHVLTRHAPRLFRCSWAMLSRAGLDVDEVLEATDGAATLPRQLPWFPLSTPSRLEPDEVWTSSLWRTMGTELAVTPVGDPLLVLLLARETGPAFHEAELSRLGRVAEAAVRLARMSAPLVAAEYR